MEKPYKKVEKMEPKGKEENGEGSLRQTEQCAFVLKLFLVFHKPRCDKTSKGAEQSDARRY